MAYPLPSVTSCTDWEERVRPPARKSLWLGEVRGNILCPLPPPEPCKVQGFVLHPTWCRVNPPPAFAEAASRRQASRGRKVF